MTTRAGPRSGSSPPDRLIGKKEVRQLVGLSLTQVKRLEDAGKFPERVRVGHRVLWSLNEVSAWIEDHKRSRSVLSVVLSRPIERL